MTTVTLAVRSTVRRLAFQSKQYSRQCLTLFCVWIFTLSSFAQTLPAQTQAAQSATPATENNLTLPAGTRILLFLTHPVQSRYTHRGDDIYAQIDSPVTSGNQVVIPPGAFLQGKINKLDTKNGRGLLHLQSMSITFPNGYVATISSPATIQTDEGYLLKDPGKGSTAAAFIAPFAGVGLGMLIGRAADNAKPTVLTASLPPDCGVPTPGCMNPTTSSITEPASHIKGIAIGSVVGAAVGTVISITLLLHARNFYLDEGTPLEMVLDQPLNLQQNQLNGAIHQPEQP